VPIHFSIALTRIGLAAYQPSTLGKRV
jgi:hypothetical protein